MSCLLFILPPSSLAEKLTQNTWKVCIDFPWNWQCCILNFRNRATFWSWEALPFWFDYQEPDEKRSFYKTTDIPMLLWKLCFQLWSLRSHPWRHCGLLPDPRLLCTSYSPAPPDIYHGFIQHSNNSVYFNRIPFWVFVHTKCGWFLEFIICLRPTQKVYVNCNTVLCT